MNYFQTDRLVILVDIQAFENDFCRHVRYLWIGIGDTYVQASLFILVMYRPDSLRWYHTT